jgi:hypothetical protein
MQDHSVVQQVRKSLLKFQYKMDSLRGSPGFKPFTVPAVYRLLSSNLEQEVHFCFNLLPLIQAR